jgi:hypothetical protein
VKSWTELPGNLEYFAASDFLDQIESGRNPDISLSLNRMATLALAEGKYIAVVVYEGKTPLSGEIFKKCWENAGSPREMPPDKAPF